MISWITPVSYQLRANARASDQLRATRATRIQSTADPHLIRSSLPPYKNTLQVFVCSSPMPAGRSIPRPALQQRSLAEPCSAQVPRSRV